MRLNFYYLYPENFFYAPQEPVYQPLGLLPGQKRNLQRFFIKNFIAIGSWTGAQKIFFTHFS